MYAFNNTLIPLGSIQFFLNATIDECIRLHTNHMNEPDSIQMNTRLDGTYAIKTISVTMIQVAYAYAH